ncbi:hypothetical protein M0813_14923 [Anaeramoeba flamelloides]|uniref:UPF3 domain-containing protein n=1 Tax=Anaeramoeba flamelloides TaxID=1746091 RepID=A0AAV7ZVT5_9EUKA|nr:hypothetical protein M0812_10803 [Anaeramoeba flamelloides]KAJ6251568.1 hypothetical protein M0813_14923 [Anaeramoeba flamelloides]
MNIFEKNSEKKLKLVVRNLPHNLTEEKFKKLIKPFHSQIKYFHYSPGSKRVIETFSKTITYFPSFSHIKFKKHEDLLNFASFMNQQVFIDPSGNKKKAIVVYSLNQLTPFRRQKDKLEGTYKTSSKYKAFLKTLKQKEEVELPSTEHLIEKQKELEKKKKEQREELTPLLRSIKSSNKIAETHIKQLNRGYQRRPPRSQRNRKRK